MKLKLELTNDQEGKIVAKSLKASYQDTKKMRGDTYEVQKLQEALVEVYHYYTGKELK